jgi:hypothetical protein
MNLRKTSARNGTPRLRGWSPALGLGGNPMVNLDLSSRLKSAFQRRGGKLARGYMMIECLVYIGVLFALLGVGYAALYRCIASSVNLRRSADDLTRAMHVGELWRADVRSAGTGVRIETAEGAPVLHLNSTNGSVDYRFADNTLFRRTGDGPWTGLLQNVISSRFESDPRRNAVASWRWELELQPRSKPGRFKPLFTFIAVAGQGGAQ